MRGGRVGRVVGAAAVAAALFLSTSCEPLPSTAFVQFSDQWWVVKASDRLIGPGPNRFAPENVSVDQAGHLHLKITRKGLAWMSSELWLNEALGYGTYSWVLGTDISNMDPNAVLGLFTWDNNPDQYNREIDFEASRWGDPARTTNAQWVVQPYYQPGTMTRWTIGSSVPQVIRFTWRPGTVRFQALAGAQVVSDWTYTGPYVPTPGDERVFLNLYLDHGRDPISGKGTEVVINSFTFQRPNP